MIEDFVERAEREEKHQTNPGDEIEKLIVAGHCAFHCRVDAKVLLLLLDQPQGVAIRIAYHQSFSKSEFCLSILGDRYHLR